MSGIFGRDMLRRIIHPEQIANQPEDLMMNLENS